MRGIEHDDLGHVIRVQLLQPVDGSRGELRGSTIDGVAHVAFMAYVKKPEYGPAQLEVWDNRIARVAELAVAQVGSRVLVDGREIPESEIDVDQLYREGYMKK